jgi:hypothetical protein
VAVSRCSSRDNPQQRAHRDVTQCEQEIYQETARLIPGCTLRMHEGKGHEVDKEGLAQDVRGFVRQHPAAAPGPATEPPGPR